MPLVPGGAGAVAAGTDLFDAGATAAPFFIFAQGFEACEAQSRAWGQTQEAISTGRVIPGDQLGALLTAAFRSDQVFAVHFGDQFGAHELHCAAGGIGHRQRRIDLERTQAIEQAHALGVGQAGADAYKGLHQRLDLSAGIDQASQQRSNSILPLEFALDKTHDQRIHSAMRLHFEGLSAVQATDDHALAARLYCSARTRRDRVFRNDLGGLRVHRAGRVGSDHLHRHSQRLGKIELLTAQILAIEHHDVEQREFQTRHVIIIAAETNPDDFTDPGATGAVCVAPGVQVQLTAQ